MIKKLILPLIIAAAGILLAAGIILSGPRLEQKPPPVNAPLVRTSQARTETVRMSTFAHGTVLPRTESELIPEVSGRVINISRALVSGGFFKKDDLLLEIDALDYEVALEQARAGLASARSELENARKAHERQLDLAKRQSTSQSLKDDALNRLQFAQASLREATARLAKAERDLSRTKITAPYDGRVRSEKVDIGQFVNRGAPIASLYATDIAEVRLPIHDIELAFLDLPLTGEIPDNGPEVILRANFAGSEHVWQGHVVRTEGELDPKTRMINIVAQVQAPYQQVGDRPPLAVGLFVEAEILGKEYDNLFVLPRSAIQSNQQVYVIESDNRIGFRDIEIFRAVEELVYVSSGLEVGDTVCLSTLSNAVRGMLVTPLQDNDEVAAK